MWHYDLPICYEYFDADLHDFTGGHIDWALFLGFCILALHLYISWGIWDQVSTTPVVAYLLFLWEKLILISDEFTTCRLCSRRFSCSSKRPGPSQNEKGLWNNIMGILIHLYYHKSEMIQKWNWLYHGKKEKKKKNKVWVTQVSKEYVHLDRSSWGIIDKGLLRQSRLITPENAIRHKTISDLFAAPIVPRP